MRHGSPLTMRQLFFYLRNKTRKKSVLPRWPRLTVYFRRKILFSMRSHEFSPIRLLCLFIQTTQRNESACAAVRQKNHAYLRHQFFLLFFYYFYLWISAKKQRVQLASLSYSFGVSRRAAAPRDRRSEVPARAALARLVATPSRVSLAGPTDRCIRGCALPERQPSLAQLSSFLLPAFPTSQSRPSTGIHLCDNSQARNSEISWSREQAGREEVTAVRKRDTGKKEDGDRDEGGEIKEWGEVSSCRVPEPFPSLILSSIHAAECWGCYPHSRKKISHELSKLLYCTDT